MEKFKDEKKIYKNAKKSKLNLKGGIGKKKSKKKKKQSKKIRDLVSELSPSVTNEVDGKNNDLIDSSKEHKAFKSDFEKAQQELTDAEKRHLERLKQNESYFIQKQIEMTHRQKIESYNKKLADLPEHNDIPKVGPG